MLVFAYWITVLLLNALPVVGVLAASMIIPGLSVGLMKVARSIEAGEAVGIQTLFSGLQENTRTLLGLGVLYLLCTLGIFGLSALADGGDLLNFMLGSKNDPAIASESEPLLPALIVFALMTPVLMAYWFAPVLAAWHQLSLSKSLFFSFVACWLNWRPFLTYGIALLLFAGIIPGITLGLLLILFPGTQGMATTLVMAPMLMLVAPTIFASFYAIYRDIFGISEIV